MERDVVLLGLVLGVGALAYLAVAAFVWRHRHAVGGRALTVLLLSACVWTLCYLAEINAASRAAMSLWGDLKYIGIVLLPPSLWCFALEYAGRIQRMNRWWVAVLGIEPALVLAALAVPGTHDLVRSLPASPAPGTLPVADSGPLFWVHLVYSYVLLVAGLVVLTRGALRVSGQHRWQSYTLVLSSLLPFVLNAAYNLKAPGLDRYDLTPIGFSITALVLVWGFFRFRLSELLPVGRRQVVDRLPDAVLVLDVHGRIVDCNPSSSALIGMSPRELVGRRVTDLLPELAPMLALLADTTGHCRLDTAKGPVDLAVSLSPLTDDHATRKGMLVVLRDITRQRQAEWRLRELLQERTSTIATLQRGLYPPQRPEVPGVDVAAVLNPAEAETNVGGDFVDVRQIGPGRWTLMVGDVVGKGAGAAMLTAVARHTTLALSALGWPPSQVLHGVSRAIASEGSAQDNPRFCTMALATLEPTPQGAKVVLSLGGHPRPLLLNAAGEVTEVGVPGHLLGVLDDPDLYDSPLLLTAGEALILFSDGVTEARRGEEDFGDDRLNALVATFVGRSADEIVTTMVEQVRAFGLASSRDDVAVLAVVVPAQTASGSRARRASADRLQPART